MSFWSRARAAALVAAVLIAGCSSRAEEVMPVGSGMSHTMSMLGRSDAYKTTFDYVVTFYPLWFTFQQWQVSSVNKFVGPIRISPIYHAVVAPNDDTLYANTVINLTDEPTVVTIPKTRDLYSVLSTDAFGDVNDTAMTQAGVYALTAPNWSGTLPPGVTQVKMTTDWTALIVRADRYTASGQDMKPEAQRFRLRLHAAPLSLYEQNPKAQPTKLLPEAFFSIPYKTIADTLSTKDPISFLTQLQSGVASEIVPALTPAQKALAQHFNSLFDGRGGDPDFISATRDAHATIVNHYLNHTDKTNWITFDSIGTTWSDLTRSSISEFIQYGNSHATAAYYQTFKDATGAALDGGKHSYVLTFGKLNIPKAERFWSVTAYTTGSITLLKNPQRKYLVGSYTPGLKKNRDGSISIYVAQHQPKGVPAANWLPVQQKPFTLMLRVYGPEGRVKAGTYLPPAVQVQSQ